MYSYTFKLYITTFKQDVSLSTSYLIKKSIERTTDCYAIS